MEVKFCPNCGAKLENGMKFCGECGSSVPSQPVRGMVQPSANAGGINMPVGGVNMPAQGMTNQSGGKKVSKGLYVILALFLGGLGGHKFYSGRIGLGILYLLFCWTYIPAIVGAIEGIYVGVTKNSDADGQIII